MGQRVINKPHKLIDHLRKVLNLRSDRQLAIMFGIDPPNITHIRSRRNVFGASYIIRTHELTGMPIKDIKAMLGSENV